MAREVPRDHSQGWPENSGQRLALFLIHIKAI
jgi:hypothetical protein